MSAPRSEATSTSPKEATTADVRLPRLLPGDLSPEQSTLYDSIARGPRSTGPQRFPLTDEDGSLHGPFRAMLLSPSFGAALSELGAVVRYRGGLPDRSREIAILVVARTWDSDFEVYAHEAVGRAAGLEQAELALIAADQLEELSDPFERTVAVITRALSHAGDLSDASFAEADEVLGARVLFELTTLVGYYATLALQLRVYRVHRPAAD